MPNFNGIEVARWLIDKRFSGKMILMTGHHAGFLSAARVSLEQEIGVNIATLEKPARVEQILELIRTRHIRSPDEICLEKIVPRGDTARISS